MNEEQSSEEEIRRLFQTRLTQFGYGCLLLSGLFLCAAVFLTDETAKGTGNWTTALILMAARTCGIASFLCGAGLVLLEQWTRGTLLFILSIVLPILSFLFLETI